MSKRTQLQPLFDTRENLHAPNPILQAYLQAIAPANAEQEYLHCAEFLKSYLHSNDTFNAYRREVERLLQWSWLIKKTLLKSLSRNDIRDYLQFVASPPQDWIGARVCPRFIEQAATRRPNPEWRPFVIKQTKLARAQHLSMSRTHSLSNKSIQAIFGVLSSLFGYLIQEEYVTANPVQLIRQKKGFLQQQQQQKVTRKLSQTQWHYVIETAESLARLDTQYERTLFLVACFYLLGLRISELAYNDERRATMGSFAPDKNGLWWFTTVGKGNKVRDVAVPDELLTALKRYRQFLGLTPLPSRQESTPLFPHLKGQAGLGTRQIRNLIQQLFDQAILNLRAAEKNDEAEDLAHATVHWLRHTAISNEVEYRPREHIRDDVGHANPATMDKYIDIDRRERHQSAQAKTLKPTIES